MERKRRQGSTRSPSEAPGESRAKRRSRARASGGAASAKVPASLAEAKRRRGAPRAVRNADLLPQITHVDEHGKARMVDVSEKAVTEREAVARGRVTMSAVALQAIKSATLKKGDALHVARLAGIMAAKRTAGLIPLCHPLLLSHVDVTLMPAPDGYEIEARVRTTGQTGVEMEALTAVSVAALTLYDMAKAVDKAMAIEDVRLISKRGGRSGDYTA